MLYMLGSVEFEVAPLNVDQVDRSTGADFAEKAILGRRPAFEFMGQAAEDLQLRGKLFPQQLGGLDEWDELQQLRAGGGAQHLMRGDGRAMGWFLIVGLRETNRYLDAQGVAKVVEFEISLRQGDKPAAGDYQGAQLGLIP